MSGISLDSLDFMNPPASAIVDVNNPVFFNMYFNTSRGYFIRNAFIEVPINCIELYL